MLIPMDRLHAEFGVSPRGVLHVGAHLGEEAPAYHAAGVERVVWLEANPGLMGGLVDAVSRYPGQFAFEQAVSDADGEERDLHLASFTMSSSLLPPKEHYRIYPHIRYPSTLRVKTMTIDRFIEVMAGTAGIAFDAFDFLNLDIEGAELLALKGATRLLPFLEWVYAEVNHEEMYEGCALLPEMDAFLEARGFERIAIQDAGYYHGWSDALYARMGGRGPAYTTGGYPGQEIAEAPGA